MLRFLAGCIPGERHLPSRGPGDLTCEISSTGIVHDRRWNRGAPRPDARGQAATICPRRRTAIADPRFTWRTWHTWNAHCPLCALPLRLPSLAALNTWHSPRRRLAASRRMTLTNATISMAPSDPGTISGVGGGISGVRWSVSAGGVITASDSVGRCYLRRRCIDTAILDVYSCSAPSGFLEWITCPRVGWSPSTSVRGDTDLAASGPAGARLAQSGSPTAWASR